MCNWFTKLFKGKNCCAKPTETAQPANPAPMTMNDNQEVKPEVEKMDNVEKPQ